MKDKGEERSANNGKDGMGKIISTHIDNSHIYIDDVSFYQELVICVKERVGIKHENTQFTYSHSCWDNCHSYCLLLAQQVCISYLSLFILAYLYTIYGNIIKWILSVPNQLNIISIFYNLAHGHAHIFWFGYV